MPNPTKRVYKAIQSNGGWTAWEMVKIAEFPCKSLQEATIEEERHRVERGSSLNMIRSHRTQEQLREYFAAYRNEHVEQIRAYRVEHAEERREWLAKYAAEHPDQIRQSHAKYRAKHREQIKEREAKYRAEHRAEINAKRRAAAAKKRAEATK
jgi:hypothetical protein